MTAAPELTRQLDALLAAIVAGDRIKAQEVGEPILRDPGAAFATMWALATICATPARLVMRPGGTALPLIPDDASPAERTASQMVAAAARGDKDLLRDLITGVAGNPEVFGETHAVLCIAAAWVKASAT